MTDTKLAEELFTACETLTTTIDELRILTLAAKARGYPLAEINKVLSMIENFWTHRNMRDLLPLLRKVETHLRESD